MNLGSNVWKWIICPEFYLSHYFCSVLHVILVCPYFCDLIFLEYFKNGQFAEILKHDGERKAELLLRISNILSAK